MISAIVVIGKNREIGCQNRLLWKLPGDMERFKKITMGKTVIMGDKTFESIGRPLPGRKNIVVSLNLNYEAPGCEVENSLEKVLKRYKNSDEEVFMIGGGTIYRLALPETDRLYLTIVDDTPEADTFFPEYKKEFAKVLDSEKGGDNGYDYEYLVLER